MNKEKQIKKLNKKANKLRRQMNNIERWETVRDFLFEQKSFNNWTYSNGRRFSYKSHFSIAGLITGISTIAAIVCMFFFNPAICITAAVAGFIATLFTNYVIPASLDDMNKKSSRKHREKHEELEEVLNQIDDLQGGTRRATKKAQIAKRAQADNKPEKQKTKVAEDNLLSALTRLRQKNQEIGNEKIENPNNPQTVKTQNDNINEQNQADDYDYDGDSNFGM